MPHPLGIAGDSQAKQLTRNPDCLIESVSTAAAYGLLAAPDVTTLTGQAELGPATSARTWIRRGLLGSSTTPQGMPTQSPT
jgi:hypothetical protein